MAETGEARGLLRRFGAFTNTRVQCAHVKFSFDSVWKYIFICMCLNSVEAKVFKEYSIVKQR